MESIVTLFYIKFCETEISLQFYSTSGRNFYEKTSDQRFSSIEFNIGRFQLELTKEL